MTKKYLIYRPYSKSLERNEQCNVILRPTWTDGTTNNYDVPLKHPTEDIGALCIDENYLHLFTQEEIDSAVELTNDWFPKVEIVGNVINEYDCFRVKVNYQRTEDLKQPNAENGEIILVQALWFNDDDSGNRVFMPAIYPYWLPFEDIEIIEKVTSEDYWKARKEYLQEI